MIRGRDPTADARADAPLDLDRRTRSGVDRDELWRLTSRPAWSIRSRRGALGPFLDLFRFRRRRL